MFHCNHFVLSFGSLSPQSSRIRQRSSSSFIFADSTVKDSTAVASSQSRRTISSQEARVSLVFALASQTYSLSQRVLLELASETSKYLLPKRFESRNLEEALMAVPDLETMKFKVLSRRDEYEIREVEPYFIAETTMPGKSGFDFNGASQSFNVLAGYLFGKNTAKETMEMTTPVLTSQTKSDGEKMDMTTPVITKNVDGKDQWKMSFVMPSKYGPNLPVPQDNSVRIQEVPRKIVAVIAFSGFVTDEEVKRRETRLRDALKNDQEFQVKAGSFVEVAQYNPPFTLPFQRRNEIALEVERKEI
ncbi:Heme-binding-like protein, chloroplastic, partial [Cucurbita argyrosperma subsp. sororia]